jgi:RNase P subunit RPR2
MEPEIRTSTRKLFCSKCHKIISAETPYWRISDGHSGIRCEECFQKYTFVDSGEEEDDEPFGVTFVLKDPRTGRTLDVFE